MLMLHHHLLASVLTPYSSILCTVYSGQVQLEQRRMMAYVRPAVLLLRQAEGEANQRPFDAAVQAQYCEVSQHCRPRAFSD